MGGGGGGCPTDIAAVGLGGARGIRRRCPADPSEFGLVDSDPVSQTRIRSRRLGSGLADSPANSVSQTRTAAPPLPAERRRVGDGLADPRHTSGRCSA